MHLREEPCRGSLPTSPRADAISASEDATLRLWDVSTAGCIRIFHGHTAAVTCAAISQDGATAASASEDGTMRVWHLATGRQLSVRNLGENQAVSPRAVCFSTSGRLLACVCEKSVGIWEMRDLARGEGNPPPTLAFDSPVPLLGATFVPNHSVLVTAGVEPTE